MPRGRDRGRDKTPVFGSQEEGRRVGRRRRKIILEEERDRGKKKKKIPILNIFRNNYIRKQTHEAFSGPKATVYRVPPAFCSLV